MATTLPQEEELREYIAAQVEKQLLFSKVGAVMLVLFRRLENRGVDIDQIDDEQIEMLRDRVIQELCTSETDEETAEVPVGGRSNRGVTSEIAISDDSDNPTTLTKEIPLRGGDVDDPETVEIEMPDPGWPDFDAAEEVLDEAGRMNQEQQDDEEPAPDDVSAGGQPWYQ